MRSCGALSIAEPESYTIRKSYGTRVETQSTDGRSDLGVTVDSKFVFSEHIRVAKAKAYEVIGMLKNAFLCRDKDVRKTV